MPVYPSNSVLPVSHLHSVEPSVEPEVTPHGAHDEFGQFLYCPSGHGAHGPPSGPMKLGMHWQRSMELLAMEDIVRLGQVLHRADPVTFLYFPAAHWTQATPSDPTYPVLHVQFLNSVLPVTAVFVCAGHPVQACGPSQSLYVPLAHSAHGPPSGPVNPATQEQIVIAATDDWFCSHMVHACTPASALNVPAAHATHSRAYTASYVSDAFSTCVYLASQRQLVMFGAAAGEFRRPAHVLHAADPGAPLYCPARQATQTSPVIPVYPAAHAHSALPLCDTLFAWHARHADVPAARLYVPAGHALHAPGAPVKPARHWHAALPATDTESAAHAAHDAPA